MNEDNDPRSRENLIRHLGEKAMREADVIMNAREKPEWEVINDDKSGMRRGVTKEVAAVWKRKGRATTPRKYFGTGM